MHLIVEHASIRLPNGRMTQTSMRAAVFHSPSQDGLPLSIEDVPIPVPGSGESLLKVLACAVCRTDLHIVEGDLPLKQSPIIPGHQIVGEVVSSSSAEHPVGSRAGVSWMGGTDGTCKFCLSGRENLCDAAVFTGYSRNGGYAEYVVARTDFLIPLPETHSPEVTAPLLCAGMIGFRSLRMAEVKPRQRVGLFGFGASARLVMPVLQAWQCEVYVATRGAGHQQEARDFGAKWVGDAYDKPPQPLDAAVTFAPAGKVFLAALKALDKGGIVAINAIHMDEIPSFDYDSLLWEERQIRSVANMTRDDARDFLHIAAEIGITPRIKTFSLKEANQALQAVKNEDVVGSPVLLP
jgi:propanol-preferring alcohol dehydrogenase